MLNTKRFMILNLPNPPGHTVYRGFAGGFGTLGGISHGTLLPIYLLYAASAIHKSGCEYNILDAQALRCGPSQVLDTVARNKPDVLIAWISLPSMRYDLNLLDGIKARNPSLLVVALGTVCNTLPDEVLSQSKIDLAVKGWYPYCNTIARLVDTLKKDPFDWDSLCTKLCAAYLKDGKVVQSSTELCHEDLDRLSLDAYYQLPLERYLASTPDAKGSILKYIPVITAAGCPYSCAYCPYPIGYGRRVIQKSISRILDELEFLRTNFGIRGFLFRDQLFTYDKKRLSDLCDAIVDRNLSIKWFVEARVDHISEEILSKMKRAGCFRIHYGVETGSPSMLRKLGKPGVEIETIKKAFSMTREFGLATTAHMIIGLPGENEVTLKESLHLLREIKPNNINFNIATPYPGTSLFEMAKKEGLVTTYDWSKYTSYDAVMSTGELSVAQISKAVRNVRLKLHISKLLRDRTYQKVYFSSLPRRMLERLWRLFSR